jgi:PAS domain S-box-containing protein
MQAIISTNEHERIAALGRYDILDTSPEEGFDQLTSLAALVCGTPMAVMSLIDTHRQWFKAKVGIAAAEIDRNHSICSQTILQNDLLVVPDAQADPRFKDFPFVKSGPCIRFYAGVPLLSSDGYALGTLCVLGKEKRDLTSTQAEALRALSRQISRLLEFRRTKNDLIRQVESQKEIEQALRESEEFKTRLIETSHDCIKVLDLNGRLLSINAGGMEALEICDFAPFRNSEWIDFWKGEGRDAAIAAIQTAKDGKTGRFVGFCPTMGGKPMWWDVAVQPIRNSSGEIDRLLAVSREVTERVQAENRLRAIVEGTAQAIGRDFFTSMVKHLANALPVKIAFATECANVEKTRARIIAFWDGKGFMEDQEYDVKNTTCERVYEGETCFYSTELQKLFPLEEALVSLNGQSYIGIPIKSSAGELIGHLAVIDDMPMDEARGMDVLKIFAARAGAELERMQAEAELRSAMAEIERLKNRLQAENIYLQEEIRSENNFEEIIGSSPALMKVLKQLELIAPTDATVLILGETGTGKELIARAIHNRSARSSRPLVKVNCGAISAGLVESELFGHVKGAFTGALEKRTGRFELADGGTLFLDEVGELPPETQVKLLRVLQEGEFEPVGSSKTTKVDVRIIAATNKDLEQEVKAGRFRADLFYRLNVLPLFNPSLRERREDIAPLAIFFLSKYARRFNRQIRGVSQDTIQRLQKYPWPGNIRELQNLIERAVVLSTDSVLSVDPGLLPTDGTQAIDDQLNHDRSDLVLLPEENASDPSSLEDVERRHILSVLHQTNWLIEGDKGAAKMLNIHPNTLRSRMKKMGIQRPK